MAFKLSFIDDEDILKEYISGCQKGGHVQQVSFSTYHNCLTQVCFDCRIIRTSMKKEDALHEKDEVSHE